MGINSHLQVDNICFLPRCNFKPITNPYTLVSEFWSLTRDTDEPISSYPFAHSQLSVLVTTSATSFCTDWVSAALSLCFGFLPSLSHHHLHDRSHTVTGSLSVAGEPAAQSKLNLCFSSHKESNYVLLDDMIQCFNADVANIFLYETLIPHASRVKTSGGWVLKQDDDEFTVSSEMIPDRDHTSVMLPTHSSVHESSILLLHPAVHGRCWRIYVSSYRKNL